MIDAATSMRQASMTVDVYLGEAIKDIDGYLGKGYAKANPQLIAAYITACVADYTITRQETMHEETLASKSDSNNAQQAERRIA